MISAGCRSRAGASGSESRVRALGTQASTFCGRGPPLSSLPCGDQASGRIEELQLDCKRIQQEVPRLAKMLQKLKVKIELQKRKYLGFYMILYFTKSQKKHFVMKFMCRRICQAAGQRSAARQREQLLRGRCKLLQAWNSDVRRCVRARYVANCTFSWSSAQLSPVVSTRLRASGSGGVANWVPKTFE